MMTPNPAGPRLVTSVPCAAVKDTFTLQGFNLAPNTEIEVRWRRWITPAVKTLLVSGYSLDERAQSLLSEGVLGVLQKPVGPTALRAAIATAKRRGYLGRDVLGSGKTFELEVRMGAGAFVCGEETALMGSIEGRRGEPRPL